MAKDKKYMIKSNNPGAAKENTSAAKNPKKTEKKMLKVKGK